VEKEAYEVPPLFIFKRAPQMRFCTWGSHLLDNMHMTF